MLPGTIRLCGTLVLGGLLCAGLAGCGAPSAAKVLEEAQAAMEAVDSYTVTVSSELRLRPQSGAEPVTAQVDAVIQATREPYALCQSAVYSLYAGEEGGVSTAVSYTLPSGDSEQAYISYLSYDGETWYVQEEPGATAERTSSFQYLSGLFAQDLPHIRVEATQFRGEDAYVLSGPLDPDATASLMAGAEDGLTGAEEALTGSVDVYLDPDAFLLLGVTVRYTDPEGAFVQSLGYPDGTLEEYRITLEYAGYGQVEPIQAPAEALAAPLPMEELANVLWDEAGRVLLGEIPAAAVLPPEGYTVEEALSDRENLILSRQTGHASLLVHYHLASGDEAAAVAGELDAAWETASADPACAGLERAPSGLTVEAAGRTVSLDWLSCAYPEAGVHTVEYNLWAALPGGQVLQCYVSGSSDQPFAPERDGEALAEALLEGLDVLS